MNATGHDVTNMLFWGDPTAPKPQGVMVAVATAIVGTNNTALIGKRMAAIDNRKARRAAKSDKRRLTRLCRKLRARGIG